MPTERPDLSQLAPGVRAYIEALEAELETLRKPAKRADAEPEPPAEPSEPPTTVNVITLSAAGMVKRTPRHLYSRQRRGGMGVFDLETPEDEPPLCLALADESETLLLFTDQGRSYRLPVSRLPETEVHARGTAITDLVKIRTGEHIAALLPATGSDDIVLVGERGWVNRVRASFFGSSMIPGVAYYDADEHGPLAAVCWVPDGHDLFIAAQQGSAIRFPSQRIPKSGCLGIRLERGDRAAAVTAVTESSGVFLLGHDGKGTLRLMEGFRANKSPGGGGKIALKTDKLVAAITVEETDDLFVISRHSKIIRFQAAEVPPKTGPVQGVNCMSLRGDETVAAAVARL